jgi:hypothetical protein
MGGWACRTKLKEEVGPSWLRHPSAPPRRPTRGRSTGTTPSHGGPHPEDRGVQRLELGPTEMGEAPRPMGNLLTPPGLLRTRYLPPSDFDEVTLLTIPHAQVDPMPNKPGAVIRTEKGIRRLKDEELARGLGLPKSWEVPPENLNQPTLSATTSSFHWEYLAQCLSQAPSDLQDPSTGSAQEMPDRPPPSAGLPKGTRLFSWRPPDLREGGVWYNERVRRL